MTTLNVLTYGFALLTDQGNLGYSTVALLEVGDRRILIDTGPAARRMWLFKALADRGLGVEDIDTLILTHMHWDHCQNADLFGNARVLVHPKEIDYAYDPNPADVNSASYFADMLKKLRVDPVSDGDTVVEGVSIIDTPGHTMGHISVLAEIDGEKVLIAGDALPDGGTVRRRLPYNVFWDVDDARSSVEKMVASSKIFYPGHDRPFKVEGEEITYLHGPENIQVLDSTEGGGTASLTFTVSAKRAVNVDIVQK